jgi:hypothetical protein
MASPLVSLRSRARRAPAAKGSEFGFDFFRTVRFDFIANGSTRHPKIAVIDDPFARDVLNSQHWSSESVT